MIKEELLLTAHGVWLSNNEPISHEPTLKLFARSLFRTQEGYELKVGRETKPVHVEDTAYFVTRIQGTPAEGILIQLSDGTEEQLDPSTLAYQPSRLICHIERRAETEPVRFLRQPYHELLSHAEEQDQRFTLSFPGKRVIL